MKIFLRQRGLLLWDRKDPRRQNLIDARCTTADAVARWVKEQHSRQNGQSGLGGLNKNSSQSGPSTKSTLSTQSTYPDLAANAALVLIAVVACSLLDRQLASLAAAFEREGGFTERLYRVRKNARGPA